MKITDWQLSDRADATEVSAEVDRYRLWYRLPKPYRVSKRGDPFLAAALLPAMCRGEKLEIDQRLPVSPRFLENVYSLQKVFHSWVPRELKMIRVDATTSPAEPLNTGIMSFFSGGVDSTYTFLKGAQEISHVVNIHGFDFYFESGTASSFSATDIKDLAQFAWKLMLPYDQVSACLRGKLSKVTLQALSNYRNSGSDPGAVEAALTDDLNRIISGPMIHDEQSFAGVHMRPQTRRLLAQNPQGEELRSLNRLLLEDAFPRELVGKHSGTYRAAIERNKRFVESFGKVLIAVETNFYPFGYRYNLSRNLSLGPCLGSVVLLLGMSRAYVPSGFSYSQVVPAGSHPLTDPLWSNECVQVIHDGLEAGRVSKLKVICECEAALRNLRVCLHDANVNCGECDKCLRTMITLRLLHASAAPFPPFPSLETVRKNLALDGVEEVYLGENIDLALQSEDHELRDALCAWMHRRDQRRPFREIDKLLFGGSLNRLYRRIVHAPRILHRIDTVRSAD